MTFVTPQNPKTSHARVRSNFARVLEWSCGVVVLRGSGESEIVDSSSKILSGWSVNLEYRMPQLNIISSNNRSTSANRDQPFIAANKGKRCALETRPVQRAMSLWWWVVFINTAMIGCNMKSHAHPEHTAPPPTLGQRKQ